MTIPCMMVSILLMEHAVQRLVLISAPTPASIGVHASALLMVPS
jgi:hypothetical protein